jgi:uncharacterized protein YjbI with pentapeptide repeats
MLHKDLTGSTAASMDPNDEVRTLARARTLTAIARVDGEENKSLTNFLTEAGLTCMVGTTICDLHAAEGAGPALLQGAILQGADLEGAVLPEANLMDTDFSQADLSEARLGQARLSVAKLNGARLAGADLRYAYLDSAHLEGAHLENADLTGAVLTGAHLEGAHLAGADFGDAHFEEKESYPGANLKDATGVTQEQLKAQTKFLAGATPCPEERSTANVREDGGCAG